MQKYFIPAFQIYSIYLRDWKICGENSEPNPAGERILWQDTFDAANFMTGAEDVLNPASGKAEYGYNGLGKRVSQQIFRKDRQGDQNPWKKIEYTLDLTREYYNLLGLEDSVAGTKQAFIWDGNVAAMEEDGKPYYYFQDDLGSVTNLVGSDGESRERFAFDEFGLPVFHGINGTETGQGFTGMVQPFAFTGYQPDETTGLYYAQARRYDAGAGRFVSEDWVRGFIEVPVTLNHYGYCWNRPLDYEDLDGALPTIVVGAIIGGVVGGVGSIVSDVYQGKDIDWEKAGKNTLKGAAAGAIIGSGIGIVSSLAAAAGTSTTAAVAGYGLTTGLNGIISGAANCATNEGDNYSNFINGATAGIVANTAAYAGGKGLGVLKMPGTTHIANWAGGMAGSITTDVLNIWDGGQKSAHDVLSDALTSGIVTGFMGFHGQNFLTPFDNSYEVDLFANLFLGYNYGVYGAGGTIMTYVISCIRKNKKAADVGKE